jgi:hypothetical protein
MKRPRAACGLAGGIVLLAALVPGTAVAAVPPPGTVQGATQGPMRRSGALVVRSPVYLFPDATLTPLTVLAAGTSLEVMGQEGDWYRVRFRDPVYGLRNGYVLVASVRLEPPQAAPARQPAAAQARRPPARRAPPAIRPSISFKAMYQASATASTAASFPVYVETATSRVAYRTPPAAALEISAQAGIWRRLGWSVAFSASSRAGSAQTAETVPHPFYFNQPRTGTGAVSGLSRTELDVHVDAVAAVPVARSVDLEVFGGPTIASLTQAVATPQYGERYPYDALVVESPVVRNQSRVRFGFNIGAGAAWALSPRLGIEASMRYSRVRVPVSTADGAPFTVRAEGIRVGAGIRVRF